MCSVNPIFSHLTNFEVMEMLHQVKSTKKKFDMRNLATVTSEVLLYLEDSPCKTQTRESILNYVKDLSCYRLKSHEILQMVNDPPTSVLHTQLVRSMTAISLDNAELYAHFSIQLIDDPKASLTDEQYEKVIQ
ncbi:hypothetical protein KR018_011727, partial [Drosophila ironensis]